VVTVRIGIIGAGMVGGTLGTRWANAGHKVVWGVRDPAATKVAALRTAAGHGARAVTITEAAAGAEVVVLATPWRAVAEVIAACGDLVGRTLLDCTNPLQPDLSGLAVPPGSSGGEEVARLASGARVVKIFNTVGFNVMADPRFGDRAATMLYCGDDEAAKAVAAALAADLGLEAVDAGPLAKAGLLEYAALLWIHLAMSQRLGREIAFVLMRR
jgi:predicted dinucleotide-binding enzyme